MATVRSFREVCASVPRGVLDSVRDVPTSHELRRMLTQRFVRQRDARAAHPSLATAIERLWRRQGICFDRRVQLDRALNPREDA